MDVWPHRDEGGVDDEVEAALGAEGRVEELGPATDQ